MIQFVSSYLISVCRFDLVFGERRVSHPREARSPRSPPLAQCARRACPRCVHLSLHSHSNEPATPLIPPHSPSRAEQIRRHCRNRRTPQLNRSARSHQLSERASTSMPPTRAAVAAAAAASTAGSMQSSAEQQPPTHQTGHAASAAASAATTTVADAAYTAAAMEMQPTHAAGAAAAAASAGGPPRASPRLALKVQRRHTASDAEGASGVNSAHTPTASNSSHAQASSTAMVDAITHTTAASAAAHGMHAPAQIPIVRSASEFTPGSGSGSGSSHAAMMHSPPLSSRASASTGVSPHCAGLQVSTPLTKSSQDRSTAAQGLFSTPSPMTLPPPTMPPASSSARRKLMGSGSNGAAAAATVPTCHGLPPSPLARATPAIHMDQTSSTSTSEQAPPRKKTTARAAAAAAASTAAAAAAAALASGRSSTPHLLRAQSCGDMQEAQRHELRLPSRRELSVDYITPRVAAMVLLGQQHKNLTNGTGGASPVSPSTLSSLPALGALSADETRQMHEWSSSFDRVHILDARFEYEYDGGHIIGAVNVTSLTQVEDLLGLWNPRDQTSPAEEAINQYQNATLSSPSAAAAAAAHQLAQQPSTTPGGAPSSGATTPAPILFGPRVCVLIHCEFSKKRGPKCFTFLRNRDRKLNLNRWPHLHYPGRSRALRRPYKQKLCLRRHWLDAGRSVSESLLTTDLVSCAVLFLCSARLPEMYCIAGGYQAFFNQQPASPTAAGCALEVSGTTVAQSLCHPPAYVSMTHPAFKKEYAVAWARMKKSSNNAPMAASPNSIYAQAYSPKNGPAAGATAGRASPANAAAADAVATPKSSCGPPHRRTKGQTRSYSEISQDMVNTASPVTLGRSLPLSAANLASPPVSLAAGAGAAAAVAVATGAAGLMGAPRSVRGLGVVLDGSATTAAAAGSGGANGASSVRSAFSFKRQTSFGGSSASIHALTHSSSSPPFVATPSPLSASSSSSASSSTGLFVPASPGPGPSPSPISILPPSSSSFFGANAGIGPCASPLLQYGWSMEGRSSTPSPFFPESPRITSSMAPSPLSWNNLSSAQQQQQQQAAAAYGRGTPTPLSMLSEDSPRGGNGGATLNHSLSQSRSRSSSSATLSNPPVFVGAGSAAASAAQAQALAPAPAPAHQRASWGGFASPSSQVSRRSSISASSPSSALHSMHLRSSPSPSYSGGGGSSSNGSSNNTQPLSSRSSSSPSPAPFYESSSVLATPRGPSLSNASTSSDHLPSQQQQHESPGELASAISGKLLSRDSELPASNVVPEVSSPSKKARYTRESTAASAAPTTRGQPRSIAFSSAAVPSAAAAAAATPCDESAPELTQCTEDMADD